MTKLIFSLLLMLSAPHGPIAAALPLRLSGRSVVGDKQVAVTAAGKKGLVVAFLSAVCPCSHSHLVELKRLYAAFPDFQFVGIHSNVDEGKDLTTSYFKTASLPFPVIEDSGAKLADDFKALKTPHVFIVLNDGTPAYQGGVSSSRQFDDQTDRKYLREALSDLSAGRKVKTPQGRTLGCVISRGKKYVW